MHAFFADVNLSLLFIPALRLGSDSPPTSAAATVLGERLAKEVGHFFGFDDLASASSPRDSTARLDLDRSPIPKAVRGTGEGLTNEGGRAFR